jgi:two-component system chemotaxis sensor kinase CheA
MGVVQRGGAADMRDVFRRAHSLKGAARAVDIAPVEDLSHRLEALFAEIMEGTRTLDEPAIEAADRALDAIEGYVAALTAGKALPDVTAAYGALDAVRGLPGEAVAAGLPVIPQPPQQAPPQTSEEHTATPLVYLRVAAEQVQRLSDRVHELTSELESHEAAESTLRALQRDAHAVNRAWDDLRMGFAGETRVSARTASRLKLFERDLQALVRGISGAAIEQTRTAWSLGRAMRRVRTQLDRVSLVPAEAVFGDLGRMARDLAREQGRKVEIRIEGLEMEADRRVLQALRDPLIHLLRNAISHGGSETAEARISAGKPETPEIALTLAATGRRLTITVADDGPGPDVQSIEKTAIRMGLMASRKPGEPAPTDAQLYALVFEPGFSTAATVDRISGRGMGLSIVAEAVRRLRGNVILRRRRHWGTEVVVTTPFLATRQSLLLIENGTELYAIPAYAVDRLLRLKAEDLESVEGRPVTRIETAGRRVVTPIVALDTLLGTPDTRIITDSGTVKAVLLRRGSRYCAIAVGDYQDVRTLTIVEVGAAGVDGELILGAVLLENDMPVPVLNPETLFDRWMREGAGLGLADWHTEETRPSVTVLVVDDSITTRTLEKSILEAQGYRVLLSVDGLDALAALRSESAVIDLVIADIEMPRMDGFALLQAIKNDPRLAEIPVVLMTSRSDPEDVRRGLELGAGAYITKQKFDQRELLATIGQLL